MLSGVAINTEISRAELNLRSNSYQTDTCDILQIVHRLNERSLCLLNKLIDFKQDILDEMLAGRLFTFNYPLLIEHIQREAKLYRATIESLMHNCRISYDELLGTEDFWNRIMMEYALFIRGLLDPSEEDLIKMADDFAMDYKHLLETARRQDRLASLDKTLEYRNFKATETEGILNCEIASIILPLLADHVLRKANHYIRLLTSAST